MFVSFSVYLIPKVFFVYKVFAKKLVLRKFIRVA